MDDGLVSGDGSPCGGGWCRALAVPLSRSIREVWSRDVTTPLSLPSTIGTSHVSCSIINSGMRGLFPGNNQQVGTQASGVGLILNPTVAQGGLMCSYPADGGTQGKPGCRYDEICTMQRWWHCVFPASDLKGMMQVFMWNLPARIMR